MAVITISREYGSGGDQIAARLCNMLGYESFGKAQIAQMAEETHIPEPTIVDYTEDNHEVQGFFNRLLGRTASPVQNIAWSQDPSIATRPERAEVTEDEVLSLLRQAITTTSTVNNMVVVGRGGQVLLKDTPGVLHVRIEAPIEKRIQHVLEQMRREEYLDEANEELRRRARETIVTRDIASADYIRRYYNVDWADSSLYHMVLNLGLLSEEQAAQIIAAAVREIEMTL